MMDLTIDEKMLILLYSPGTQNGAVWSITADERAA